MDGKTALGASSPPKPPLTIPDPLSTTRGVISSSSLMVAGWFGFFTQIEGRLVRYGGYDVRYVSGGFSHDSLGFIVGGHPRLPRKTLPCSGRHQPCMELGRDLYGGG